MERRHLAERHRLMESMEENVNDYRRNVQFTTHVTPQTSFQRNGNTEQYVYTQQEIGDT